MLIKDLEFYLFAILIQNFNNGLPHFCKRKNFILPWLKSCTGNKSNLRQPFIQLTEQFHLMKLLQVNQSSDDSEQTFVRVHGVWIPEKQLNIIDNCLYAEGILLRKLLFLIVSFFLLVFLLFFCWLSGRGYQFRKKI
jgi:hypothetical protein